MERTGAKGKRLTLYRGELTKLASELGRSPSSLCRLFQGKRPSKTLAQAVYDKTGCWPDEIEVSASNPPEAKAA